MSKKAAVREVIYLACAQCQQRSYTSSKNRRNDPQRLELKKFCPRCRAHTPHRETK
ncbi:MAG: 50S ribosomal protein L33 [Dehalococcoidia bacterium]|nr:50S ribosomal protein L33 [Dehalococcoidia bacterium]